MRTKEIIGEVCRWAIDEDYLGHRRLRALHNGMTGAVRSHDTAHLYGWLTEVFSYQGITDARASAYMDAHGRLTYADVARGLNRGVTCPKLLSFWHFHRCGYAKSAATHGGIPLIPVLVAAAPDVSDRAAAFVSHAVDRVQANPLSVHPAAVVAGDPAALVVDAVCRDPGVNLLGHAPSPCDIRPRDLVALATVKSLIKRRGPDQARAVLAALAAAHLAPIAGDSILAADAFLCDEAYAGEFDGARVAATFRALSPAITAEARALAAAKNLPVWRALTATLYRRAPKRLRPKASASLISSGPPVRTPLLLLTGSGRA